MDVTQYLSEDEMKKIAEETFRKVCEKEFKKGAFGVIYRSGYAAAGEIVAQSLGGHLDSMIAEKAIGAIEELSVDMVFHRGDRYAEPSPAYQLLMEQVESLKGSLRNRAEAVIATLNREEIIKILETKEFKLV